MTRREATKEGKIKKKTRRDEQFLSLGDHERHGVLRSPDGDDEVLLEAVRTGRGEVSE